MNTRFLGDTNFLVTAPGGFEPPTLAPKAKMLPLHHGATCAYRESLILFKYMHSYPSMGLSFAA
jgi:hypothetical protein